MEEIVSSLASQIGFFQSDSVAVLCSNRDLQAEVELVLPDTSPLSGFNQLQLTSALTSSVCH